MGGLLNKMLEWCSTSHAYDIARQDGIDMKGIRFESTKDGGVHVHIDAPGATAAQIEALGKRVEKECPVAAMRGSSVKGAPEKAMKWLPESHGR